MRSQFAAEMQSWRSNRPYERRRPASRRQPLLPQGGERLIVTKHGKPFVEMVAPQRTGGVDFAKLAVVRENLGLTGVRIILPDDFGDPAYSRRVLGLEE
jgi:antitoxin (DNA-binding transcriptional repressor) of toxin-antitoxin stability system